MKQPLKASSTRSILFLPNVKGRRRLMSLMEISKSELLREIDEDAELSKVSEDAARVVDDDEEEEEPEEAENEEEGGFAPPFPTFVVVVVVVVEVVVRETGVSAALRRTGRTSKNAARSAKRTGWATEPRDFPLMPLFSRRPDTAKDENKKKARKAKKNKNKKWRQKFSFVGRGDQEERLAMMYNRWR